MNWAKITAMFISTYFISCQAITRPLHFSEEYIDFKIDSVYFYVNGIYTFRNTNSYPLTQIIEFPFAYKIQQIDSIIVYDLVQLCPVEFYKESQSVTFSITLPALSALDISICYQQKLAKVNTYILTSTQTWGKPLDKAVYNLKIINETLLDSLNYKPDSVKRTIQCSKYYFTKYNFMPQTDFIVYTKQ